MHITLFDSEIKLMELVWALEPVSAKDLSLAAGEQIGWNKNTTYTVIKKLENKGYLRRDDPGYICTSLISHAQVQKAETENLIMRMFGGSKKALFSALLDEELTAEELETLRHMIDGR